MPLGRVNQGEPIRELDQAREQDQDLRLHRARTFRASRCLVTHTGQPLEQVGRKDGMVSRREQKAGPIRAQGRHGLFVDEVVERLAGQVTGLERDPAKRIGVAGPRKTEDVIEGPVEVGGDRAVEASDGVRQRASHAARPQEHADHDADRDTDQEVLDANDPNLPPGRNDEVEHDDEQQAERCLTGREADGG